MLLDGLTIRENILIPRIIQGKVDEDAGQLVEQLADFYFFLIGGISCRLLIE